MGLGRPMSGQQCRERMLEELTVWIYQVQDNQAGPEGKDNIGDPNSFPQRVTERLVWCQEPNGSPMKFSF